MSPKIKELIRNIIVAVLTAILTYFTASCALGVVMGNHTRLDQEVNPNIDSASIHLPAITIYK